VASEYVISHEAARRIIQDERQNLWRWAGDLARAERAAREWVGSAPRGSLPLLRLGEIEFLRGRMERGLTVIAAAADAISASRPGARSENLDRYVKRLEQLEAIAKGMAGVTGAYAIQAGREVRVLVDSDKINDGQALVVARDIAKSIEQQMTYPGEIRVTVLRETRVVEYAR
jgi:hypothetical protein